MSLIVTEEKAAQHAAALAAEAARAEKLEWIKNQLRQSVWIEDETTSLTNAPARMGVPMSVEEFERKLLLLNPNFMFQNILENPKNKRLLLRRGTSEPEYLIPYESCRDAAGNPTLMPEHSIMSETWEDVMDPIILSNPNIVMQRADLTKHEIIPAEFDEHGRLTREPDVIFDPSVPRLGSVRVRKAWREQTRGYRTVLAFLVMEGICSIDQVERVFGSCDGREWAAKTGKHPNVKAAI